MNLKILQLSFTLIVLFCSESCPLHMTSSSPIMIQAKYGQNYEFSLNKSLSYFFGYSYVIPNYNTSIMPPRISVRSVEAVNESPLLVVVYKQRSIQSWQIPYTVDTKTSKYEYEETSRTLCPHILNQDTDHDMVIAVSSLSPNNVAFSLVATLSENFIVGVSDTRIFQASPSESIFYNFQFGPGTDSVLLVVESTDQICMTLSVQNISCPVVDLENNVQYKGQWQTVSSLGGMLLKKSDFPHGLFIVFVVHSDDLLCSQHKEDILTYRKKNISFSIEKNISDEKYLVASLSLLSIFAMFYILAFCIGIKCLTCCVLSIPPEEILTPEDSSLNFSSPIAEISSSMRTRGSIGSDSSLDETDIDFLHDSDRSKEVFRTKTHLFVSDLSRKNHRILSNKAKLYYWNLVTVSIFYSLPVVQLVLTYQKVLNDSGNEDICYYNYLCSHPLWILSDFNHIFTNVGYVFLGFLFILITINRERFYNRINEECGIPQHYGFYYSMGMALIMEGVLSACYHVCPSHNNFQFDTSFMYIIVLLSTLKIYQSRHPDINATAYSTFVAMAFIIFIGMVGTLADSHMIYVGFTVIHLLVCLVLSVQIYHMGRWKLDWRVLHRMSSELISNIRSRSAPCRFMYPRRLIMIIFGNLFNWALAAAQLKYFFVNFGTYLLAVLMVNLCLYLLFYILMKYLNHERLTAHTAVYLLLACCLWGCAMYFFVHKAVSWERTPAQSRTKNHRCIVLNFYDSHDIWHVLSALAMFFSFMTLLALDDDVIDTPRSRLSVF